MKTKKKQNTIAQLVDTRHDNPVAKFKSLRRNNNTPI